MYRDLEFVLGAQKVTASIDWEPTRDSLLTRLLAGFTIAVLLAHVALGFAS